VQLYIVSSVPGCSMLGDMTVLSIVVMNLVY